MKKILLLMLFLILVSCKVMKSNAQIDPPQKTINTVSELSEKKIYNELMARNQDLCGIKKGGSTIKYYKDKRLQKFSSEELYKQMLIIYGKDNRYNCYEPNVPAVAKRKLDVVACLIEKSQLESVAGGDFKLLSKGSYSDKAEVCVVERFGSEPVISFGSGFAISDNLFVTASHCINKYNLRNVLIVYGYRMRDDLNCNLLISSSDIYEPTSIHLIDEINDITVIRVEKAFKKNRIAECNTTGNIEENQKVFVVGYPSGLPIKVATNAMVIYNTNSNSFIINSDTSKGNSGSPVFNADTGLVEGIMLGGMEDFSYVQLNSCYVPMRCPEKLGECSGETAAKISLVLKQP